MFAVGLVAGGVLSATVLWLLSGLAAPLPEVARYAVVFALAALAVPRDLGLLRLPLPQNARQIPQAVLQAGTLTGAGRFGLELGTGVRTYVSASAPYVLAAALLVASPGVLTTLITGVGFGIGRAATPVARALSTDDDAWDALLRRRTRPLITGAAVTVAALLAALLL